MNLFVLDENPRIAARYVDDARVGKMLMEACQVMSYAHTCEARRNQNSIPAVNVCGNLYAKIEFRVGAAETHRNHPVSKWVRECTGNYAWAYLHAQSLAYEFEKRYGHAHAYSFHLSKLADFSWLPVDATDHVLAMPDEHKVFYPDAVKCYRSYWTTKKTRYQRSEKPEWLH